MLVEVIKLFLTVQVSYRLCGFRSGEEVVASIYSPCIFGHKVPKLLQLKKLPQL
jgi:hypothetical protein